MKIVKRGEIWWGKFDPTIGSEQGGIRPSIVIQNDTSNKSSATTIILPITSKKQNSKYTTNVLLPRSDSRLKKDSVILCNQIRTIDKARLIKKVSMLDQEILKRINKAIKISLDLD